MINPGRKHFWATTKIAFGPCGWEWRAFRPIARVFDYLMRCWVGTRQRNENRRMTRTSARHAPLEGDQHALRATAGRFVERTPDPGILECRVSQLTQPHLAPAAKVRVPPLSPKCVRCGIHRKRFPTGHLPKLCNPRQRGWLNGKCG